MMTSENSAGVAAAAGAAADDAGDATVVEKTVRVTLVRSMHGRRKRHQACVRGLGLRRMHQAVEVADTPQNRGMIRKVKYMLKVEPA